MIPSAANSDYPKFVANQVLTSGNLNNLFEYLDEQQRISRTNLTGIGIVCGLQVKTGIDSNGKFLIISKGTGITSQGYLVTVPDIQYNYYNSFDAVQCKYYNQFVNIDAKTQKFPLWELKQEGETEDPDNPFHKLDETANFLNNKVVLLFVELLEINNKNCDPNSCDDKGTTVMVSFRPLLANKADADSYLINQSDNTVSGNAILLPELKMPRYDVTSTLLLDTEDVFQAYQDVLSAPFISNVKSSLSNAWSKLSPLLADDFPEDPFSNLETQFAFLRNGTISVLQAINLQYYFDFFSDLILAYDELKRKSLDVVCECLPDESAFPRHLLLGEATGFDELNSKYRTRFIYSPVLCCCADDAGSVRSLFLRLVLMIENFSLVEEGNPRFLNQNDLNIKITPSLLGREPLSERAIPFYYKVNSGTRPLYQAWNQARRKKGTADQILSYRSNDYNTVDDFVKNPLKYDLEPNNFLRIEGHIGQDYRTVLADIESQKLKNRLPVDVIALSSDTRGIFNITEALGTMDTMGSIAAAFEIILKHPSCFSDIFLALDEWINKLRCCLLENRQYFMALPSYVSGTGSRNLKMAASVNTDEEVPLETEFTIGKLYEEKLKAGTIDNQVCNDIFVDISTNKAHYGTALVMMPYKIDRMISALPDHITKLDVKELEYNYADLTGSSARLKTMYAAPNVAETMTGVELGQLSNRLEMNCLICLFLELRLLIKEFLMRLLGLMIKQKLGFYAYTNPGLEHKAGVPKGGTFVIVYHEQSTADKSDTRKEVLGTLKRVNAGSGKSMNTLFSGDQALLSSILLIEEFIFLQKVKEVEEEPNEVLDKIVQNLPAGIVIADFYLPYLCCSNCPPSQMVVLPSPETTNLPPVARPGEDVTIQLPDNSVTLDGSSSADPDGTIQTYQWQQASGPGTAVFDNSSSAVTLVSGLIAGEYEFKLTVIDNDGASNDANVKVTVKEKENIPPTAIAFPDKLEVMLGDEAFVRLFGDRSFDLDGTIESYFWKQTGGSIQGASIQSQNAPSTNVQFFESGEFTFTLTVTDNDGAEGQADVLINVIEEPNQPPVAKAIANPTSLTIKPNGSGVSELDGSGSFDPEGKDLTFKWTLPDGTTGAVIDSDSSKSTFITFTQAGSYSITLTVTDDKNAKGTDVVRVDVKTEDVVDKTCGPLSNIVSDFDNWNKLIEKNPDFKKMFSSYQDTLAYFEELSVIMNDSVEKQMGFFSSLFNDLSTPDLLIKWMNQLHQILMERKDFRLIALLLYRILFQLSMFIVCIQKEDFDQSEVPMREVFEMIREHILSWLQSITEGVFSSNEIKVVRDIGKDIEKELKRIDENGETILKGKYVDLLKEILDFIVSGTG